MVKNTTGVINIDDLTAVQLAVLKKEVDEAIKAKNIQLEMMKSIAPNQEKFLDAIKNLTTLESTDYEDANRYLAQLSKIFDATIIHAQEVAKLTGCEFSIEIDDEVITNSGYGFDMSAWQGSSYNC
jgi:DNA integrity scanning protein DisA with diadenylate cyclase activity